MGEITFGVPRREVKWLRERLGCNVFIEGGTYKGNTARAMASEFELVITIENHEQLFQAARKRHPLDNIQYLYGDTRNILPDLLSKHNRPLIWLDSHWSGPGTYGLGDECPLMKELDIIFESNSESVVLIDDARLFLRPPPSPHDFLAWPSIDEVIRLIPQSHRVIVSDDVIFILHDRVFNEFRAAFQEM